jgi:23S rRNA A1618 N6-methylase RlmF
MLVNAKRRGDAALLGVLALLTGNIFLSTPHSRDDNKPSWSNAIRILHSRSKRVLEGVEGYEDYWAAKCSPPPHAQLSLAELTEIHAKDRWDESQRYI